MVSEEIEKKASVFHVEDANSVDLVENKESLLEKARQGSENEHELGFRKAVVHHKKAIFWAMVMSATIIMEGYDTSLMSSFYAYPSFKEKYGVRTGDGTYELEGRWQVALGCASSVGTFFGVLANGYLTERFGHRRVIMGSLIVMSAFIFIPFFAPSILVLLVGQVMCGLPWGIFATMGPSYSSEVCPLSLRGYLTAYVNMCWAIGQFVAAGVLKALVANSTHWGYRIPFAIQWVWPIPLFVLTYLAPDSPWWLVRKGRIEDAEKAVKRLSSKTVANEAKDRVALMIHTNSLEVEQENENSADFKGWKSYVQCFQGTNLRRTEIVCLTFSGQIWSGSSFAYSPTYFFSQAGLNPQDTYKLNLGVTGVAFTGCIVSWFLLSRFGRRTIYVTGYSILTATLLLIGILSFPAQSHSGAKWAQAGLTLVWVATYSLTIGPLAFTIVSEMSATRLRAQTIALARDAYNLTLIISRVVEPYLINPGELNLKGKTAFVWLGTALVVLTWSFFRLPETRNRTYEELDLLFARRISARRFGKYDLTLESVIGIDVETRKVDE